MRHARARRSLVVGARHRRREVQEALEAVDLVDEPIELLGRHPARRAEVGLRCDVREDHAHTSDAGPTIGGSGGMGPPLPAVRRRFGPPRGAW